MAAPLKAAFGRPVCCTLQGEELFLNGLVPPYRSGPSRSSASRCATSTASSPSATTARRSCRTCSRFPRRMAVVPLGISMTGLRIASAGPREDFCVGYFARIAPEKGLHVLAEAYSFSADWPGARAIARRRLHGAGTNRVSGATCSASSRARGLRRTSPTRGASIATGKIAFLRGLDVLSVPATYDEPKGSSCSKRWRRAFRWSSRDAAVSPRSSRRPAAGSSSSLTIPSASRTVCTAVVRSAKRRSLGERAIRGRPRHYTIAQSADRLLDVYRMRGGGSRR